jgi:hypothetical protein
MLIVKDVLMGANLYLRNRQYIYTFEEAQQAIGATVKQKRLVPGQEGADNASITWLIINLSEGEKHDKNYLCTV